MNRFRLMSPLSTLMILNMLLCMFSGSVSAQGNHGELTWPVETELHAIDWTVDEPDAWVTVGNVIFTNGNENLQITVVPDDPYRIKAVHIHVVRDMDDFDSVVDNKGKPQPNKFDYKKDYLEDGDIPAESHLQVISLDNFDLCWAPDPEKCPPYIYAAVHVELQQPDKKKWVDLPEAGWADNGGVFMRTDKHDDRLLGRHATYPIAKVEPGHFIDAIVNGLGYVTITQSGITEIITNDGTTGEQGQFWYIPGERVAFYAGSVFLGDALGDRQLSPPDLFEGADMDDDRVVNVARLLQSLDSDGVHDRGAINITAPVIACLESALTGLPPIPEPDVFFADDAAVGDLIDATVLACAGEVDLAAVTKEQALENLNFGMQGGNLMKRNVSKTPGAKSDKAKIEIMPVYVPAQRPDGTLTEVAYFDADGEVIEERSIAKPIVVSYLDEGMVSGAFDVYVAISRDDGDSWKRKNVSRTAGRSSLLGFPGKSEKPMLKVKDNKIFVAWTDKYCRGGRPGYAITVCPDTSGDGLPDPCEVCRDTDEGTICMEDYPGDDAYWQDDIFGVGGPHRSVNYDDEPGVGEVPYSCVWSARAIIESDGNIQWFKPERITSGRRDAFQLFAGAGEDVAFAIVWQEDPKGLMPGEGDGPGDGWSGANTHSKTDIWYSYITMGDFGKIDHDYPMGGFGEADFVDTDPELGGQVKALVPMSLPVKISDNDVCSLENIAAEGGNGEHDYGGEGEGTHRYCGTLAGIGTEAFPGTNPLCAYTVEKANPHGEIHHVCVTADNRLLDGDTGASRANIFLQPYTKDGVKSAWAIIGYEESKGVGTPPEEEDGCGDADAVIEGEDDDGHDDRYKPDTGKNVIYHSFDFANPQVVASGNILNLPETDEYGNLVYLVDEFGELLLDWKGDPQLAYENARRIRFLTQPKKKAGASKTVLVALYRQGEEGSGKPADIFLRRLVAPPSGNPYAFNGFISGAQNVSSVEPDPDYLWQDPYDSEKPVKMLRWSWSPVNLADSSARNPYSDARAHRGALNGDDLIIGYTWTPNWGRRAIDKYDFYVRRSFNGGQAWTTDPVDPNPIEHSVVFRVPVLDEETQTVAWDEEVVTTEYGPGASEPPRNVSNLRNNRTSVLEPRLVKTPGTILTEGEILYPEDEWDKSVYQLAYGLEFNQNQAPVDVIYPKMPLDIYYSQTMDKGQRYQSVIVTPQSGNGKPEEGWNPLAKDQPEQGAVQLRQTPDGSRMYGIWLEESSSGSDIMFRRVDYRD